MYFDKSKLSDMVKIAIPAVNVWFFFIRKNCLPRCLTNLSLSSPGEMTNSDTKLTIELLIVQYMSGIALMPGAHGQFQFWFTVFVPLLLGMIGLPGWVTCLIPMYFYPIEGDPAPQHQMLLGVCAYLLIVGPAQDLIGGLFNAKKAK